MRLKDNGNSISVWLSARDTEEWATKPGAYWPGSTIRGKRISAAFDTNGLYDVTINGRYHGGDHENCESCEIDGNEFNAIMADHIKTKIDKDHPVYFVTCGQFQEGK